MPVFQFPLNIDAGINFYCFYRLIFDPVFLKTGSEPLFYFAVLCAYDGQVNVLTLLQM